jgi:RNA 2',3'-cyclic 3'-phosphodiesterase
VVAEERPSRLFVAVPLPPEIREACRELIEPVRTTPSGRYARWVGMDTLHVTLRFLGDTPPDLVPAVAEVVTTACRDRPSFTVTLAGAGSFPPGGRKIRALWLGIAEGADELASLVHALEPGLAALGWSAETRAFRPHLTVARTDATGIRDAALTAQALEAVADGWETSFAADRVVLYRSHLGSGKPRHDPVVEVVLQP